MHVQIKHSFAHLQDLISVLAGIKYIKDNTSQSRDKILYVDAFVHAFGYMVELTVAGWCIAAIQLFLTSSS